MHSGSTSEQECMSMFMSRNACMQSHKAVLTDANVMTDAWAEESPTLAAWEQSPTCAWEQYNTICRWQCVNTDDWVSKTSPSCHTCSSDKPAITPKCLWSHFRVTCNSCQFTCVGFCYVVLLCLGSRLHTAWLDFSLMIFDVCKIAMFTHVSWQTFALRSACWERRRALCTVHCAL